MSKCSHNYNLNCDVCGQDASYKWITCPDYKRSCPDYVCIKCGEITPIKKEQASDR